MHVDFEKDIFSPSSNSGPVVSHSHNVPYEQVYLNELHVCLRPADETKTIVQTDLGCCPLRLSYTHTHTHGYDRSLSYSLPLSFALNQTPPLYRCVDCHSRSGRRDVQYTAYKWWHGMCRVKTPGRSQKKKTPAIQAIHKQIDRQTDRRTLTRTHRVIQWEFGTD